MNTAPRTTNRRTRDDYRAMARAKRADEQQQALRAPLVGRTLDTTPVRELSPEELRARIESTAVFFRGL